LIAAPALVESLWPLTWIGLVPLFAALRNVSPQRAFLLGWWAETLMIWLGFYWLVGTMVRFGFIPVPLSLLFLGVIGLGNGLRLGLFSWWICHSLASARPWWYRFLLPPCAYVALDYLFPRVFPWYLGFTQLPALPLIQIADLTGVYGITFLLVACNVVVTALLPHPAQPSPAARGWMSLTLAGLLLLTLAYGAWRLGQVTTAMQQAKALRLAIIQPNIGIGEKGQRTSKNDHLRLQVEMSQATLPQRPDLIIWPESMYPFSVPPQADRLALPPMPEQQTHWLVGALVYERQRAERQVFNSALLVAPDARIVGRYDKQQLLAFGEYIPLQRYLPFLRNISPTIGNLTPGDGGLVELPSGVKIGTLICYEDILAALGRRAVQQGAQVLVNLTNDAWFGRTRAPYLHRSLAAFRAVENRVYLVRATNTGLTSIIDARGHEQTALPLYQREALVHTIQPLRLSTLYTRFGDWFAHLCCVGALAGTAWHYRYSRGTSAQS
jgi:apolipoprotein N-acyltransferase